MGEYIDGQNILLKRPEPGRHLGLSTPQKEDEAVDVDSIANAVIKALESKLGSGGLQSLQVHKAEKDTYDTSASLNELAKAMIVSKDVNSGNINDVGTVKETKKDNKETNKTIDLLSKLGE